MPHSGLWIPKHLQAAKKTIAVVFYEHHRTGYLMVGFPDQFDIPRLLKKEGFRKVVCRSAAEVDRYDKKMRDQERRQEEMTDEQREAIEGPIRDHVRKELQHKMATSRNAINRDFCRWALQQIDEKDRRSKMKRESFMHIVGFENGK